MSFNTVVAGLATPTVRWKLDELSGTSAADASGNGNTGTIAGSPTLGSTSLLGDGSGTAITVAAGSSQQVSVSIADGSGANQPTFSCFVRAKPSNLTGTKTIIGRRIGAGVSFGWTIRMDGAALTFYPFPGFSGNTISFGNLTANQTYSIGLTYNVSTGATVAYLDGSSVASHTSPTIASGTVPFCVGGTGTEYFTGVLDEAIYWSGTLLTGSEMSALHAAAVAVDATVTAPNATASSAAPAPLVTGTGDATVVAPVALSTATGAVPSISADSAVTTPRAAATAAGAVPSVSAVQNAAVLVPIAAAMADAIAPFVSNDSPNATIQAPAAHATAAARVPGLGVGLDTDVSNVFDGRERNGFATVVLTVPVVPVPAGTSRGPRVDKAVPLPLPTLVNGRPT